MKSLLMVTALLLTMVTVNAQASNGFCMKAFMNGKTGRNDTNTIFKPGLQKAQPKQPSSSQAVGTES